MSDTGAPITKQILNSDHSLKTDELIERLASEAGAIADKGGQDEVLANVRVQQALLIRDTGGDNDLVINYCDLAPGHPIVTSLLTSVTMGAKDPDEFQKFADRLEKRTDELGPQAQAELHALLGDAWLYRFNEPAKAAKLAGLAMGAFERLGSVDSNDLNNTFAVALACLKDWSELEAFHSASQDLANLATAAHLALDRLDDSDRALLHLKRLRDGAGHLACYSTGFEMSLKPILGGEHQETMDMLDRRIAVLEAEAGTAAELSAVRFSRAELLEHKGDAKEALSTFNDLSARPGWSTALAHLSALRLATSRSEWKVVATQLGSLGTLAREKPLRIAYHRRRAEVVEHCLHDEDKARKAWKQLLEMIPHDAAVHRSLQRLQMENPEELLAVLLRIAESPGRDPSPVLRRAVGVAETRIGDLQAAADLARRCADTSKQSTDLHGLARVYSRLDQSDKVAGVYNEIASMEADERIAAPLLFMAAVHELRAGRQSAAMQQIAEAQDRAPNDLAIQLLSATIHRTNGDHSKLKPALLRIATLSASKETQFHTFLELTDVCKAIGDMPGSRAALAGASELRPDDADLFFKLADMHIEGGAWPQAVAALEKTTRLIKDKIRCGEILAQIGQIEDRELGNTAAALDAYERARELDPDNIDVLQACQRLYGEGELPEKQLALLREELEHTLDPGRRFELFLKISKVSVSAGEPDARIIEAYVSALEINPNHEDTLERFHSLAVAEGDHKSIAKVFAGTTPTISNLEVLCESCQQIEDWAGYAEARFAWILQLDDDADKIKASVELADLWENKLHNDEKAVAAHQMIIDFDAVNRKSQAALRRLLERTKQWRQLVDATEAELRTIADDPTTEATRVALLLRMAEVRRFELKRESEACLAYEAVLAIDKPNKTALQGLEVLYESLGRAQELLRVKQILGKEGEAIRAREIAELRVRTGDIAGACEAYLEALQSDPSDRQVFTTLEKLCYSHERWDDVMTLYNSVIMSVESGESKAYRLGDLYSRRGQVQLKYMDQDLMAVASFLRVIEVDPTDDRAMETLHGIYEGQGAWVELIAAYEQRAELAKTTDLKVAALNHAAEIAQSKLQDRTEAARLFQALSLLAPADAKANETLEEFYTENEDWENLVKVLEARNEELVAAGEPDQRLVQRLAKLSEESLRDEKRAVRYYRQLSELAPQNRRALDALARIFESTERWTEFVEVTRRLVKLTKDRNVKALLYFKCGSVTEAKFGNEEDAIRYYDAAIKTSPSCLPAVHGLRDCYLRRQDWARVIQTLELEVKLWQDDKERAGVFAQIGRIYREELGEIDRSMQYYENALNVDPDCVPANRALFEHFFSEGMWAEAHNLAQSLAPKALRDGDPQRRSEFYRRRGIVARHTGDPVGAAESMVIALEIRPENIAAIDALVELAAASPGVYDFGATFSELEKIYRKRNDANALLGRVMVGQANIMTAAGNLQGAQDLLASAVERCPQDFTIVTSLVDLHASTRNWRSAVKVLETFIIPGIPKSEHIEALMRQATLYSHGQLDARLATHTLERILEIDDSNPDVYYLLAQELYSLERYEEAKRAISTVIELSAQPGSNLSAEHLARYYYYLGRIHQRGGDQRAASAQYRRASEYDPGYAPPALALAMHAVRAGDQSGAETRLLNAAHAAMGRDDRDSAIPLQRGLARVLLRAGDRDAAIEAYRGILEVEPDGAVDRLSLAEIYAETDLPRAIGEVLRVIQKDLRHGPAYPVLAGYYMQADKPTRALRVLNTMELLGYAERKDKNLIDSARTASKSFELTKELTPDLRRALMANSALSSVVGELFTMCTEQMAQIYPRAGLGDNLVPLPQIEDTKLHDAVGKVSRLFGLNPEVYIADEVPSRVVAIGHPRQIVVLDRILLEQPENEILFALGWAFDGICGQYAPILDLGEKQRRELGILMRSLFMPKETRNDQTNEFVETLPLEALEVLRLHEGDFQEFDMAEWIDGMNASASRAGLLTCDDLSASARLLALLSGESIADNSGGLGKVFCGEDLFQFQMSEEYEELRLVLAGRS
jgi:tetratricopeptide (TPR) repeat protein